MNTLPQAEQTSEKIIILTFKKYFAINYGKINELLMRKWITEREYLTLWCLLIGNFKVKAIFDLMLKCGMKIQELKCFFDIDEGIIKEYS